MKIGWSNGMGFQMQIKRVGQSFSQESFLNGKEIISDCCQCEMDYKL
jgi:hypothetical protein